MKKLLLLTGVFTFSISIAQDKLLTIQDAVLKGRTSLAPKRLQALGFIKDSNKFSYIDNNVIKVGDNATGKTTDVLSLKDLNGVLKSNSKDTLTALTNISWKNANQFYFSNKKGELLYSLDKKTISETDKKAELTSLEEYLKEPLTGAYSYCKDNNLYVVKDGKENQVTTDGSYEIVYTGKNVHQNEFGIDGKNFWSPKGNFLAYYRMDQSPVTDYPIIDWTTRPAKNENIKYPMAGNKSHHVTLGIYDVKTNKTIFVKTDGDKEQYLTNIAWSPDEKHIYIAVLSRAQNDMKLNEYDAATGNYVRTLFEEHDDKYTEPLHPMLFLKNNPSQFIWQSRKDGYTHFYLYNINGTLIKQLTKGNWEVKSENGFDEKGERLFFHANDQSPVNQDFYSVNIKSGEVKRLTYGNGFHTCVLDEKGNYIIDNFSSSTTPREYNIINTSSKKAVNFYKAENPIKDYKTGSWNLFTIKNNEGTDLHCRLFKPINFDSTKKYPVLVYLYNGPHSQMVTNTWMAGGELWYQYMAEKGYMVFTLDGRGTSYRGKAFEQATHRQLGTKEMEDQLKGVDYLKSLPYVDASRIGVHGWSFGGFMTTTLMTRSPGTFKVGAAGGPVIDWTYYEIMYTERYMDSPQDNKEGYEKNNLLNYVDKLKGKLLMIHGAQDPVVVWQHSVMYQKKAVDKGIQLDYYLYPGHEHNVLGKDRAHLMEKITNYFIENL
ncbi:MAG: DPP IV N-terminal domain-containing protein [Bacteroidetes bacterium]|jgi:dipeptidyl-peptidase-4|nr:DPP IV N-terminal domain-containing protein [Bacteroidota bacterium]